MSNPRFVSMFLLTLHSFVFFSTSALADQTYANSQTPSYQEQQASPQLVQQNSPNPQVVQPSAYDKDFPVTNLPSQDARSAPQQTARPTRQTQTIDQHSPRTNQQWAYYLCNSCTSRSGMIKTMRCNCDTQKKMQHFTTSDVIDYSRNSDNWHYFPCTVCKHVTNTKEMSCYCRIPTRGKPRPRPRVAPRPVKKAPQQEQKVQQPVQEAPKPPVEPEKIMMEETTIINNYYGKKTSDGSNEVLKEDKYNNTKKYDDIDADTVYKG